MNNKIFGLHSVLTLLQKSPQRISELFVDSARQDRKIQSILSLATRLKLPINYIAKSQLDHLTNHSQHQGVLAIAQTKNLNTEINLESILENSNDFPLILILDHVQDPHNLGACLRTADAFNVSAVIAPKDQSVGITPIVSKVACGAAETVPFIQVTNLVRTIEKLKKQHIWIFGAAAEAAQSLYQTDFNLPAAIILGSEGAGLRRLTKEHCDVLVNIPMLGTVTSLNVSVAAGIFLSEIVRQRNFLS